MNQERLYNLLPLLYRQKDLERGGPLRALLAVMEEELQALEQDVAALYDNWFIETCDEWAVSYIGELLGIHGLNNQPPYSQRSRVANTIGDRRRKGTTATLAQVARDVTGWPAKSVEFFQLLATTQSLKRPRSPSAISVDLRLTSLEQLNSPFETTAHTLDVRSMTSDSGLRRMDLVRGRYNIRNLGLFMWRLQSYPVELGTAFRLHAGAYTFNPFGLDAPLFNPPQTPTEGSVCEVNVPAALRRRPLQAELEALRQSVEPQTDYFGVSPGFQVFFRPTVAEPLQAIPATAIQIGDLSHWQHPHATGIQVAVDPVLGRLAFPQEIRPTEVRVSYAYGFSADLGGGPYDRRATLAGADEQTWQAWVCQEPIPEQAGVYQYRTLSAAIDAWLQSDRHGIIQIADNATYHLSAAATNARNSSGYAFVLRDRHSLTIEAADGKCPCLSGDLHVTGNDAGASLTLNGLWLDGAIHLRQSLKLNLLHCTLNPRRRQSDQHLASIQAAGDTQGLQVAIIHCITGAIRLPAQTSELRVQDSIIDGGWGYAIAAPHASSSGPPTSLERTTVFGQVAVTELAAASDILCRDRVEVQRQHAGFIRFSYVPAGSKTPRRYHCQPDVATVNNADEEQVRLRLKPAFTSVVYGTPGYAQLTLNCPLEIQTGSENGSEIGAFHSLARLQREVNLHAILHEYLPYGLEAGIFYVT